VRRGARRVAGAVEVVQGPCGAHRLRGWRGWRGGRPKEGNRWTNVRAQARLGGTVGRPLNCLAITMVSAPETPKGAAAAAPETPKGAAAAAPETPKDAAAVARKHLRNKAVEFDEADGDGDQEITYDEFCRYILPRASDGKAHSHQDLKSWWSLMDYDGDGFIRKDEFFLYALCAASRKAGSGIASIFQAFDEDGSGQLDEFEFELACEDMGFGDAAAAVFGEHANLEENQISYMKMLKTVEARTNLPEMRAFLLALSTDSMLKVDTSSWSFGGADADKVRTALGALLRQHAVRLSDVFRQLDDDGSFSLTREEFQQAFWQLGYKGEAEVVDSIFSALDQDGSSRVGFDEFNAWVHGRRIATGPRPEERAANLSLEPRLRLSADSGDEAWTPSRLQQELGNALAAEGLRGMDLLKAWDRHGDVKGGDTGGDKGGERGGGASGGAGDRSIDKKEYLMAMKRLCGSGELWYSMARDAAVESFAKIDLCGDKSISVRELCKWVDPHGRLIAAGRAKSKKGMHATKTYLIPAQSDSTGGGEEATTAEGVPCYSPTKLSTRLELVRAYDPDLDVVVSKRGRPPLWAPKEAPRPPPPPKTVLNGRDISSVTWREPGTRPPLAPANRTVSGRGELTLDDCYKGIDARGEPVCTTARVAIERDAANAVPRRAMPSARSSVQSSASQSAVPLASQSASLSASLSASQGPSHAASASCSRVMTRITLPRDTPHRPSPRTSLNKTAKPTKSAGSDWYAKYSNATATPATQPKLSKAAHAAAAAMPSSALALKPWSAISSAKPAAAPPQPPEPPLPPPPPPVQVPDHDEPSRHPQTGHQPTPAGASFPRSPAELGMHLAFAQATSARHSTVSVTPLVTPIGGKTSGNSCPTLNVVRPHSARLARPVSAPFRTDSGWRSARGTAGERAERMAPAAVAFPVPLRGGVAMLSAKR
jgi:Ca2+-binding EF-hand superfamily protein